MASFFSNHELWNPKEKIWKVFSLTHYQGDTVIQNSNCYYLSKGIWKQISLEIGQKTLYYKKGGIHRGQLPLNCTTFTRQNYEGQIILRLQRNGNSLDFIIDSKRFEGILKQKCIQRSFHEHYLLEKMISEGNKKARIFQAKRKSNNERLAVRAYSKEFISKFPHGKKSLKNEIKALRMLSSKHIIKLHEVHESENSIYLIMDLIEGGKLTNRMSNQLFSIALLTDQNIQIFMYNFIKVLNQMHKANIILRNIEPDNILFQNESYVDFVIIDFGEVQLNGSDNQKPYISTEFQAPEIFKNEIIDEKCDIYSAGVIFFKLLVQDQISQSFDFQNKQFTQAPKPLQSLIKKMLRANPKNRYNAEKCLQHRYFKKLFNPNDIIVNTVKSPENLSQQQDKCSPNKLLKSERLDSGSSSSIESSHINNEKKSPIKQSKFSKFCAEMKEYYVPQCKNQEHESSIVQSPLKKTLQIKKNGKSMQFRVQSLYFKKSNSLNS